MNPHWRQWTIGPGRESPDYPIPRGIELTSCDEPLIYGRSNQSSLQIPSSSNAALLLVDGSLLHGNVRITSTSARKDSVGFSVSLSPRHNRPANTIVCAIRRSDGELGLGVFVSLALGHYSLMSNLIPGYLTLTGILESETRVEAMGGYCSLRHRC